MNRPDMEPRHTYLVRKALLAFAVLGACAGAFVLYTFPPTDISFYPKCVSYRVLGVHCPGCGTTRALYSLLHGRFEQSVAYNPLALVLVPYLGLTLFVGLWHWAWGTSPRRRRRFPAWVGWLITAGFVVFWVLRNIPVYPLTLLAPHELTP